MSSRHRNHQGETTSATPGLRTAGRHGNIRSMYVIHDPARPHVVLDMAVTLQAIALALVLRSEPELVVYASQDGHSCPLNAAEQDELDSLVAAARS
ncbi:MAG: hypothetical protein ACRDK2_02405 [Solirubrobacteraceae bacterium]